MTMAYGTPLKKKTSISEEMTQQLTPEEYMPLKDVTDENLPEQEAMSAEENNNNQMPLNLNLEAEDETYKCTLSSCSSIT